MRLPKLELQVRFRCGPVLCVVVPRLTEHHFFRRPDRKTRCHQAPVVPNGEPHLALEGVEIELDEVGKAPLEHEIGHASRKLHRLVGVAAEADHQLARAPVDSDSAGIGEQVGGHSYLKQLARPPAGGHDDCWTAMPRQIDATAWLFTASPRQVDALAGN